MKKKRLKQIITITALTLTVSLFSVIPTYAAENKTSTRLEGPNRYSTATAIANELKTDKFTSVVISYGYDFPDALSGSVLASKVNAPILLVGNSVSNSAETLNFIKNNVVKDGTIYLLGGETVVKNEIVNDLQNSGFTNFKRLGGANRYETNTLINKELNVPKGTPVAIASGLNFPDALSISSTAGSIQMPIYLVGKDIKEDTINKIKEISPSTIYIAGGTTVISSKIENELKSITTDIVRFDGQDRYDTSLKIANHFNLFTDTILVANALNFPDALSSSVLASKKNAPVILVPAKGDVSKQKDFVYHNNVKHIIAVGGESVVSKQLIDDLVSTENIQPQKALTPQEIETKLPSLDLSLVIDDYINVHKVYKPTSENFSVHIIENRILGVDILIDNESDADTIKTILNWALPTAGNEVYDILTNQPDPQLIVRDGKVIEFIKYIGGPVGINIGSLSTGVGEENIN